MYSIEEQILVLQNAIDELEYGLQEANQYNDTFNIETLEREISVLNFIKDKIINGR